MSEGCNNCTFNWPNGKKKIPYCVLKKFPILNPDVGCTKKITRTITADLLVRGVDEETNDEMDNQERFEI
jgi:hypothetical protein